MKVLQVIHGYPMRYNAGSEVYTQGLAQVLAERHEVHVFTRQENSFLPEYITQREADLSDPRISLHVINMARARDGYRHTAVDAAFAHLLDEIRPGVVHIGHLNHLSTSLVFKAREPAPAEEVESPSTVVYPDAAEPHQQRADLPQFPGPVGNGHPLRVNEDGSLCPCENGQSHEGRDGGGGDGA